MPKHYIRWYEKNPILKESFEAWENFPHPLRRALGKYLYHKAKSLQKPQYLKGKNRLDAISRSFPQVQVFFKRRRWYDQDPFVRKAFLVMGDLDKETLVQLAEYIIMLKIYSQKYNLRITEMSTTELDDLIHKVFSLSRNNFFDQ